MIDDGNPLVTVEHAVWDFSNRSNPSFIRRDPVYDYNLNTGVLDVYGVQSAANNISISGDNSAFNIWVDGINYLPSSVGITKVVVKGGSQADSITVGQMPSHLNSTDGIFVNGGGGSDTITLNASDTTRRFVDAANGQCTINAVETGLGSVFLDNTANSTVLVNKDQFGTATVVFYDGTPVKYLFVWNGGDVQFEAHTTVTGAFAEQGQFYLQDQNFLMTVTGIAVEEAGGILSILGLAASSNSISISGNNNAFNIWVDGINWQPSSVGIATVAVKGGSRADTIYAGQMPSTLNQSYGVVINGGGGTDIITLNAYDTARRFVDAANAQATIDAVETGSAAYLANAENATVYVNKDQYGSATVAFYDGKGVRNLYVWNGGNVLVQAITVVTGFFAVEGGTIDDPLNNLRAIGATVAEIAGNLEIYGWANQRNNIQITGDSGASRFL